MADVRTKYYVAGALLAIGVLVAGPVALTAFRGDASCPAGVAGAQIGGPFELVSETGETVTDAEVIAEPSLIYFGYTFCPDVCPLDAARNAEAVDLLAERGHDVTPVFITVDPERDTPEMLAEFTDYMHPDMIGLTGSDAQVAAAAKSYRVVIQVPEGQGDDYLVSHTTFTYLVLPDVGLVDFFRRDATAEELAERTACHLTIS